VSQDFQSLLHFTSLPLFVGKFGYTVQEEILDNVWGSRIEVTCYIGLGQKVLVFDVLPIQADREIASPDVI
jgi:hypothetical protein